MVVRSAAAEPAMAGQINNRTLSFIAQALSQLSVLQRRAAYFLAGQDGLAARLK